MKASIHFAHTVDRLDKAGEIIEQLAGVGDYELAEATWLAAVAKWPRWLPAARAARTMVEGLIWHYISAKAVMSGEPNVGVEAAQPGGCGVRVSS